ncbi:MAG: Flagellar basal body rod protein FlgB [candidate division BRC1 bacterium ADurb.BinA292]|nr:MAG: Flagellar basal body rod protein FlgB [candidate division BRC1 bacterium ADurb.BinA292]
MEIFGATFNLMERAMDVRMDNQRVITSNIANLNTPGYAARKLNFEASLERALQDPAAADPVIEASAAPPQGLDGNNVVLEDELSALGRNKLLYTVTAQLYAAKLRQLASALDDQQ